MQTAENLTQTKTIGDVTYIVKTIFNGDNSGTVTEKMKKIIESRIVKSPLKDEK